MKPAFSSILAPFFAASSALAFNSLGTLQNSTVTPNSACFLTSFSSSSHKSRFFTGFFFVVNQPCFSQPRTHFVAPLTTYSESVAMTRRFQPSPNQALNCRAPMTARTSALLLVWGYVSPEGPWVSSRKETSPTATGSPGPDGGRKMNPQPARGFCWPLSRQAPSV